jgi:hypothetical protein
VNVKQRPLRTCYSVAGIALIKKAWHDTGEAIEAAKQGKTIETTAHDMGIVATTSWLGFAVSANRRAFKSAPQQDEIGARNIAKHECETATLRTCSVIAVPESADVSAVGCAYSGKSESFLGGSTQNGQTQIALNKARDRGFPKSTCVEFYTY